jgi:orotate phosphoribosyltransferase
MTQNKKETALTDASVMQMFNDSGALLSGHFRLTSGLHSASYFQCALVLQYPKYCQLLAKDIVNYFKRISITVVISPAIGGIVVGQEIGRQLGVKTIFTERKEGIMKLRRGFSLSSDDKVFVCEDVVTTGGSVFEVIDIVKEYNAEIAGVGFIVDRSNGVVQFGVKQHAVIRLGTEAFNENECPLCEAGIPIQKPGSR